MIALVGFFTVFCAGLSDASKAPINYVITELDVNSDFARLTESCVLVTLHFSVLISRELLGDEYWKVSQVRMGEDLRPVEYYGNSASSVNIACNIQTVKKGLFNGIIESVSYALRLFTLRVGKMWRLPEVLIPKMTGFISHGKYPLTGGCPIYDWSVILQEQGRSSCLIHLPSNRQTPEIKFPAKFSFQKIVEGGSIIRIPKFMNIFSSFEIENCLQLVEGPKKFPFNFLRGSYQFIFPTFLISRISGEVTGKLKMMSETLYGWIHAVQIKEISSIEYSWTRASDINNLLAVILNFPRKLNSETVQEGFEELNFFKDRLMMLQEFYHIEETANFSEIDMKNSWEDDFFSGNFSRLLHNCDVEDKKFKRLISKFENLLNILLEFPGAPELEFRSFSIPNPLLADRPWSLVCRALNLSHKSLSSLASKNPIQRLSSAILWKEFFANEPLRRKFLIDSLFTIPKQLSPQNIVQLIDRKSVVLRRFDQCWWKYDTLWPLMNYQKMLFALINIEISKMSQNHEFDFIDFSFIFQLIDRTLNKLKMKGHVLPIDDEMYIRQEIVKHLASISLKREELLQSRNIIADLGIV